MTFLPDVNVWLAIAVVEHEHHREATAWLESTAGDELAFCRVTQMGFLRLLTNSHAMKTDCLTPNAAWRLFDRLCQETGARIVAEPEEAVKLWRTYTFATGTSPNAWTDAWIVAFAEARSFTVVSFDRGLVRLAKLRARLLKAD